MEKVPTAEEILEKNRVFQDEKGKRAKEAMIEFAKLHVQAALTDASKKKYKASTGTGNVYHTEEAKKSILKAYPLENIQ